MAAYTRNSGWRTRGGKSANNRGRPSHTLPSTAFVFRDLEECVATLSVDTAKHTSDVVRLRHVKLIASYSWIDAPVPTMVVPGSPWIWADERPPVKQVPLDSGVQQIHHDASKMGNERSPLLPLFAAIDALHGDGDFCYRDIDLCTDRNGLRKLLRYVDGVRSEDDFRIDIDLVGKTCLFTRREEEEAFASQNTGYGNEYLKATTRAPEGCGRMLDHKRIVTYKFGSLKILLSYTADACVERRESNDEDDVLASFASLKIGDGDATKLDKPSPAGFVVRLDPSRALVPQSDLIEIKTRSTYREPNWRDIYPQLYLSQTAWLYMARHTAGVFEPVEKLALTGDEMKEHADAMEGSLGKLKVLLKDILRVVREQGEGVPLSLVRQWGTLSLWRRKEGSGKPLGEEITARFS